MGNSIDGHPAVCEANHQRSGAVTCPHCAFHLEYHRSGNSWRCFLKTNMTCWTGVTSMIPLSGGYRSFLQGSCLFLVFRCYQYEAWTPETLFRRISFLAPCNPRKAERKTSKRGTPRRSERPEDNSTRPRRPTSQCSV